MFALENIPALVAAVANTGRILIVNNATVGDVKNVLSSTYPLAPRAYPEDVINGTITGSVVEFSLEDVFENPKVLDSDCAIVLTDAQDAFLVSVEQGSVPFNHFMSIAQRRGYKAAVVAPIDMDSYDSHAGSYCVNVRIK